MKFNESLGPNFFPWLTQQVCVPVVSFLAIVGTPDVPRAFNFGQASPRTDNCWSIAVAWIAPFLLALLINRWFPGFAEDGRLIWVLPVISLAMFLCSDLLRGNNSHILRDYFFPNGEGEAGLPFVFFTIPTWSCIAYSTGVVFARRMRTVAHGAAPDDR